MIAHLPRAEHRVLLGLWHLAGRWGHVTPEGTLLPLALSHDLLGQLTAARRSTVTLAANALESEGCIRRMDDGAWLLTSAAEHKVAAITRTSGSAPVLGETFMFRQQVAEVSKESRALRAEAKQVRAPRRNARRRPPRG